MFYTIKTIKRKKCFRAGFTIIEMTAALFLLSACIITFSQLVAFVASQRSAEGIRQSAVDQLQNVLEQVAVIPDEKLIALDFDKTEYEATTTRAVPGGQLVFSCKPKPNETASVQSYIFEATVSWNRGNLPRGEVSMFRLLTLDKNGSKSGKGEEQQ